MDVNVTADPYAGVAEETVSWLVTMGEVALGELPQATRVPRAMSSIASGATRSTIDLRLRPIQRKVMHARANDPAPFIKEDFAARLLASGVPIGPLAVSVSVDVATPALLNVRGPKLQDSPEIESPAQDTETSEGFTAVLLLVPIVIVSKVWVDCDRSISREELPELTV